MIADFAADDGGAHPAEGSAEVDDQWALRLYTPAQAAEMLAVKESWLRRKAGLRAIPSTFVGKHLRFSAADLRAIAALGTRAARDSRKHPQRR
ncbi:helix-turn-helix domain-containing protein [Saccharothrix deserti]|uniref:helix-turn-helix domain-containing protein n=1 Tax=Saccharothrix deserti TaxID=2593674 RepID=UPI001EE41F3B|nr:helix-turn-helix domain-containing protein [Saccharothrix deserti]